MPTVNAEPDFEPDAIIEMPGGITIAPVSPEAVVAAAAATNHRLIQDPTLALAPTMDGLTFGSPTATSAALAAALATPGSDAPLVAQLATTGDMREVHHLSARPGTAALRDFLLPPVNTNDPVYENASRAVIADVTSGVRTIRWSSETVHGLHLDGPPAVFPTIHEMFNGVAVGGSPSAMALQTLQSAVALDWIKGLSTFDGRVLIEASDTSSIQRDDVARARIRNVRAFTLLLVPGLSVPVFMWRQLRRLAQVPEVMEVLRRLDYPIGRGDEDKVLIDAVNALPCAPTLASCVEGLFARSPAIATLYGRAPIQRLPSWFTHVWEQHLQTPLSQADPLHALEEAVRAFFGPTGIYHTLTRNLGQYALPGSDITAEIGEAASRLSWGAAAPISWDFDTGYYDLDLAHTDGVSADWIPSHLYSLRVRKWFFGGSIGSARIISEQPTLGGLERPTLLAFHRDMSMRPIRASALRDPSTVVGVNATSRVYWRNALATPASVEGLMMMMGFRSAAHLEQTVAAAPGHWAHLVTLQGGQLTVTPGVDEFVRSEYSVRTAHGMRLDPGSRVLQSYFRFAGGQMTRAWDPLIQNPTVAALPTMVLEATWLYHITGRGPIMSLDPAILAPLTGR